jgi:hypothetical protein
MSVEGGDPVVLRPRLGRRIGFLAAVLVVLAICIGGLIGGGSVILSLILLPVALFSLPFAAGRLFVPKAYTTELDASGFRVHDSFGRVAHDVRWEELRQLGEIRGNAPLRPGADRLVGFNLHHPPPPKPRLMRKPGVDGYLPDPYTGYEEVEELMARFATAGRGAPGGGPDLTSF